MHMFDCFYQLVTVVLDALLREVVRPTLNSLVQILFHEFKYEGQTACWLIIQNLNELYNVRMWIQPL